MIRMDPEGWLDDLAEAKHAGRGDRLTGTASRVRVLGSASPVVFLAYLMVAGSVTLLIVDPSLTSAWIVTFFFGLAFVLGWPFLVVATPRGLLTRRGWISSGDIAAVGWAARTDSGMTWLSDAYVPVLIVRKKHRLTWWPLPELRRLRRGAANAALLRKLVGTRTVSICPMPTDVVWAFRWPY